MIEIFDFEQNSPEWYAARCGIPTASRFEDIIKKGRGDAPSAMRRTYMLELAGEAITGEPTPGFTGNAHTERGHRLEEDVRKIYAFSRGVSLTPVGFVRNGMKGCSPDSFVGSDGMLEIKSKLPKLAIDCIDKDIFPEEHKAQCQGGLWVCEREWIDIAVYWPGLPLFIKRAHRDEKYIATMAEKVDAFNEELDKLVDRIRAYGMAA
ncbi:lambda exonuclease family protein [Roseibium suaedae]|uniref:YqaJ-like recombinase domain-containing protein n=1 Tax=Roseibium suaedae TaxID=735517 RepID=A0A1M7D5X7_9HYPH|nr:lambda exonuclease family protein [Roseibium suaedae]SHL74807.1 YqaJ-like recombinase domain-containing protein [Roseibium suaedae]